MRIRSLLAGMTLLLAVFFVLTAISFADYRRTTAGDGVLLAAADKLATDDYEIIGKWIQQYNGEDIACKEIYLEGGVLKIKYVWLDKQFIGGRYSAITAEGNDTFSFTETYKTHVGNHEIRLVDPNTIKGTQTGGKGAVSRYVMIRK